MSTQKRFSVGGFHIPYKLEEIQDTPEVIAAIDKLEIGESWDDGNGSETVTRLADASYTPDGITLTLSIEQYNLIQQALGIACEDFTQLAVKCRQMGDVRHCKDNELMGIANAHLQRASDMTDVSLVLKSAASNG